MKTFGMFLMIISILGFTGCSKKESQNKQQSSSEIEAKNISFTGNTSKILNVKGSLTENTIPTFSWIDEKNHEITLESYKGKVIIINFWATWCGPCKSEIPDFIQIYRKYKEQGVEILGISIDSEIELKDLAQFVGENDITYQIVHDNGDLQNAFGSIKAIPTTYIIGKDFKVKNHFIGALSGEQLEKLIKTEL
jgi:thiol-disulfide isomerase/thioredoxin